VLDHLLPDNWRELGLGDMPAKSPTSARMKGTGRA